MLSNAVPQLTYYSRYILYRQVYEELMEETTAGNFKAPRTALCQYEKFVSTCTMYKLFNKIRHLKLLHILVIPVLTFSSYC